MDVPHSDGTHRHGTVFSNGAVEEENGEELFLTQRDPIDMDIDTDSESDNPRANLTPKPIQNPVGGNDDHLFVKPGMSPMSQKKAKPSTTKIYTPSSRSASLVLEMEKELSLLLLRMLRKRRFPDCPQQCHLQKHFNLSILHNSQSHFLSQHAPHAPKLVTSSKISSTSEPPSYKVYQRPEAPVNKPVPTMDPSPTLTSQS